MSKYAEKILKKFRMFGCNPSDTLLVMNEKLKKEDGGRKVDGNNYRSLLGNLFYLTNSRPNIMFAISLLYPFRCNKKGVKIHSKHLEQWDKI